MAARWCCFKVVLVASLFTLGRTAPGVEFLSSVDPEETLAEEVLPVAEAPVSGSLPNGDGETRYLRASAGDTSPIEGLPVAGAAGDDGEGRSIKGSGSSSSQSPTKSQVQAYVSSKPGTFQNFLRGMGKVFHFVEMADKNQLLSGDQSSSYWVELVKYFNSVLEMMQQQQLSFGEAVMESMFRTDKLYYEDKTGANSKVTLHKVFFDPVGNLFKGAMYGLGLMAENYSLWDWWERVRKDYDKYMKVPLTIPEKPEVEEKDDLPEGVLTVAPYDPFSVGINTILKWLYVTVFWASYLPDSGIENIFAPYPIITPDGDDYDEEYDEEYYDEYEDEEYDEYEDEEYDGEVPPEGEDEYAYDYEDGEGDYYDYDTGKRRGDGYQLYLYRTDPNNNHHYPSPDHYPIPVNTHHHTPHTRRSHAPRERSDTPSSDTDAAHDYIYGNTFGHGVGGAHVAATLPDANLVGK